MIRFDSCKVRLMNRALQTKNILLIDKDQVLEAFIILKRLHFMDLKEKRGVKRRQNLFI